MFGKSREKREMLNRVMKSESMEHTNNLQETLTMQYLEHGEACFQDRKYKDAIDYFSKCIQYRHNKSCGAAVINAYIHIGIVYCLLGYDINAMENFMLGLEYAVRRKEYVLASECNIHISWVYRMLGDYERAIKSCEDSIIEAKKTKKEQDKGILRAKIYIAQMLAHQGKFTEALQIRKEIEESEKPVHLHGYVLNIAILDIELGEYQKKQDIVTNGFSQVIEMALNEQGFIWYFFSYLELCKFALEHDRMQECRELLDCLHENAHNSEVGDLRQKVQALEAAYRKKYCPKSVYLQACLEYLNVQLSNEAATKEMKRGSLENIERLRAEEEEKRIFERESKYDLSTGLLNKNALEEKIRYLLDNHNGNGLNAMIIMDVDCFKAVNDNYGHLMGDKVILALANLMKREFTEYEVLGRFGGDEFIIFIQDAKSKEWLKEKTSELKEKFAKLTYSEATLKPTISIGISYTVNMTTSYETMFCCADKALYKAKDYGRNIAAFFALNEQKLSYEI